MNFIRTRIENTAPIVRQDMSSIWSCTLIPKYSYTFYTILTLYFKFTLAMLIYTFILIQVFNKHIDDILKNKTTFM